MRNAKLWSVLLAAVLLCACIAGVLFTGANAADTAVNYTVDTAGTEDEASLVFTSIADALANAAEREWKTNEKMVIAFSGSENALVGESELMFGQTTIWRRVDPANEGTTIYGNKLPIEIIGQTADNGDTIVVNADRLACANNYTFKALTLDLHSHVIETKSFTWAGVTGDYYITAKLFAGSGEIIFDSLTEFKFGSQVFGDNFTAEAFAAWTAEDFAALQDEEDCITTSVTFRDTAFQEARDHFSALNLSTELVTTNSWDAGICAVGAARNKDTGADAYEAAISDSLIVTPADTKAAIYFESGTVKTRIGGYAEEYSARVHTAIIKQTGGSTGGLCGDEGGGHLSNNIENGNIVIEMTDCTTSGVGIRVFYGGKTHNDMTVTADAPAGEFGNLTVNASNVTTCSSVYLDGNSNKILPGKAIITLNRLDHAGKTAVSSMSTFEYLGIAAEGGVENTITDCRLSGFSGTRLQDVSNTKAFSIKNVLNNVVITPGSTIYHYNPASMRNNSVNVLLTSVTNTLTDCTLGSSSAAVTFRGAYKTECSGPIVNTLTGCTVYGDYYGASVSSASVLSDVVNNIDTCTFKGNYYGVGVAASLSDVTNHFNNSTVTATDKIYYGSTNDKTLESCDIITNNISGSSTGITTFYGAYYDSADAVYNTMSGGTIATFNGVYYGEYGEVHNTIESGATLSGGYNGTWRPTKMGDVYTTITGGEIKGNFYSQWARMNGVGKVITEVTGGTFSGKDILFGGYGGPVESVETTISGNPQFLEYTGSSTFNDYNGHFMGAGSTAWPSKVLGDVVVTIKGGTFGSNTFMGARSCHVKGDMITNIEGGTFNGLFYGGNSTGYAPNSYDADDNSNYLSLDGTLKITYGKEGSVEGPNFYGDVFSGSQGQTDYSVTEPIDILTTVYNATIDGSFYGGCKGSGVSVGTVTNNIYGTMVCDTLTGGESFNLGTDAKLTVNTAVTNKADFVQIGTWQLKDYVVLPADNATEITAANGADAKGTWTVDKNAADGVILIKGGAQLRGMTFILDDRLYIRALFDKAVVENCAGEFTYEFKMGNEILAANGISTMTEYQGYQSVILAGLGAIDFSDEITYTGAYLYGGTMTVVAQADLAVQFWPQAGVSEEMITIAKAIADFGRVAKDPNAATVHELAVTAVDWTRPEGSTRLTEGDIVLTGKSLVMTDAIGIRLYGTATEGITAADSIKVTVNGTDVTELCIIDQDGTTFTVDMYVTASMYDGTLTIEVQNTDKTVTYLKLIDRVDAIAEEVIKKTTDNTVAKQALIYIQAVNAYKNA